MNASFPRAPRARALALACLMVAGVALPALAQGLRPSAPTGLARPAPRPATAAAADARPQSADFIVAVVNSEPITNNEVRARMVRIEQQFQQQGQPLPPRPELAREVLDRLITEKAQLQLARETGVKVEEALVEQAEQNVARQNQIGVTELHRRLVADGIGVAAFREELRNQVLLTRLRDRELESRVKVSELDIDQYLRDQQNANDPAGVELNLAHILVAVPENATEAELAPLRVKAQRVQERARAGEDFAKLARELSDAPGAAASGGVVGLRTADRYPPLFVQATDTLAAGGISEIVRSGAGFHVVKVLEKRKGGVPGTTVVQNRARHILLRPTPQLSESAAIAQLADFKKRIEAGQADFATLARQNSQDGSAAGGGDLGWAGPGMFVPEFEEALNRLAPNQIAEPLVSRFGVHLIQLVERRQQALSQREQREVARNLLREKKMQDAYVQWTQDVRGRAFVELREPPV